MSEILTEVPAKRHVENEAIREAVEKFLKWSGWMEREMRRGSPEWAMTYVTDLAEAYRKATGMESEQYT